MTMGFQTPNLHTRPIGHYQQKAFSANRQAGISLYSQ